MFITKILFNILNLVSVSILPNNTINNNTLSTKLPDNFNKIVFKNYSDIPYFSLDYIKKNFLILKEKKILWKKKISSYSNNKAIQIQLNNERLSIMKHCFLAVLDGKLNKNKKNLKKKKEHTQTFDIYYNSDIHSEIEGKVNGISEINYLYYYHWNYTMDYIQLIKGTLKMYNVGSYNLESDIDIALEFEPVNKVLSYSNNINTLYPFYFSETKNKTEIIKKLNDNISNLKCSFEAIILFKKKVSEYFINNFGVSFGELLDLNIYISETSVLNLQSFLKLKENKEAYSNLNNEIKFVLLNQILTNALPPSKFYHKKTQNKKIFDLKKSIKNNLITGYIHFNLQTKKNLCKFIYIFNRYYPDYIISFKDLSKIVSHSFKYSQANKNSLISEKLSERTLYINNKNKEKLFALELGMDLFSEDSFIGLETIVDMRYKQELQLTSSIKILKDYINLGYYNISLNITDQELLRNELEKKIVVEMSEKSQENAILQNIYYCLQHYFELVDDFNNTLLYNSIAKYLSRIYLLKTFYDSNNIFYNKADGISKLITRLINFSKNDDILNIYDLQKLKSITKKFVIAEINTMKELKLNFPVFITLIFNYLHNCLF